MVYQALGWFVASYSPAWATSCTGSRGTTARLGAWFLQCGVVYGMVPAVWAEAAFSVSTVQAWCVGSFDLTLVLVNVLLFGVWGGLGLGVVVIGV